MTIAENRSRKLINFSHWNINERTRYHSVRGIYPIRDFHISGFGKILWRRHFMKNCMLLQLIAQSCNKICTIVQVSCTTQKYWSTSLLNCVARKNCKCESLKEHCTTRISISVQRQQINLKIKLFWLSLNRFYLIIG